MQNNKIFHPQKILTTLLFTVIFSTTSVFATDLPLGYKNIRLRMSLQETKENLIKEAEFGYHGENDVSLVPGTNKVLIETDAEKGHAFGFLTRCFFQFYNEELFIITININTEKMDYYSVFTTLSQKYGNPTSLNPQSATWKNDEVTMILEKPLSIKYIDNEIFKETQNTSNIQDSPTEITREMFLEEL